jgi:hypothetical protein
MSVLPPCVVAVVVNVTIVAKDLRTNYTEIKRLNLVSRRFYLLISLPTCFGLKFWPYSGSS